MSHLNRRVSVILYIVVITTSLHCSTSSILDPLTQLQQQHPNRVSKLPGQDFCINFEHYSGYVTVNEGTGRSLFYWLTEAVDDPSSKPLLLWLNGGPGCSAIAYGMAEEIGPFHINKDGKSLYLNPHSWNQVANLLFLDSPVGVGFSYPNNSSDNMNHGDKRTAEDSLAFLLKWVEQFPQYKGRDFYIAGESYAGHYVPQLSQAIVRHNSAVKEISINLKGFMVGNALIDDFNDHTGIFQFMWAAGMISDQTYKQLNLSCGTQSFVHPSLECNKAWNVAYNELGHIDPYSIFTPTCSAKIGITNQLVQRWHKLIRTTQSSESYDPCTAQHTMVYFNLPEVQNALHVQNKNASSKWQPCSNPVYKYWNDSASSMIDVYHELIRSGIRIWVFSGDTDAIVPVTSTRYSIVAMNLPTAGPWHAWYEDGQVGGWTQQYQGLTFVTVRGAGHEVPLHKPKQALTLFKSFISGSPMPTLMDSGPSSSLEQLSSNTTSSLASSILT